MINGIRSRGLIAADFVDAVVLITPIKSGLLRFGAIVACGARVKTGVIGESKHDRPHHLVVLVIKQVTMVYETRVLPQLVGWNVEVDSGFPILLRKIGFCPSYAKL